MSPVREPAANRALPALIASVALVASARGSDDLELQDGDSSQMTATAADGVAAR